jgi:CoA:oxalate CoA-transferase
MGAHHSLVCPCGVFKGPQGYMAILVLERQWPNMARAMGRPDLETDPRFATGPDRGKNQKELIAIIEDWLQTFPSDEDALKVLEEHRIAAAPVLSIADAVEHPYFKARNMVRTVPDPIMGEVTIPGFPLKFSAMPDLPDIQAPLLGEHGPRILAEYLGLPEDRIAELRDAGVLHQEAR